MSATPNDPKPGFSGITDGADSPAGRTHTVEEGENLSAISSKVYGSANRWQEIFDANRDQLDDPDLIRAGQVLRIP